MHDMAMRPRATAPASAAKEATDDNDITSVSISRGFTVGMGDFSSIKVSALVTASTYEAATAEIDRVLALEIEKAGAQFSELAPTDGAEADDTDAPEDAEATEDAEGEAEGYSEEDIAAMTRPELVTLVEENELGLDPTDYAKNKAGLEEFKQAIIAIMQDGAEEGDDTDDSDGAEGDAEEAISEEDIMEMDRPTLVALIADNELDVDHKKLTKLSGLRAAVVEAIQALSEAEADEPDEAEATAEGDEYTEEDLSALAVDDIKAIWTDWEIPGKYPPGPPNVAKKLAIKKILAFQSAA
jgi:hypothetical protein